MSSGMDLRPVLDALMGITRAGNITTSAGSSTIPAPLASTSFELPITVLESFIPGYGLIRKVVLDLFGFDVSIAVSILGFLFLLRTSTQYVWQWTEQILSEYCTCSIDMDEDDEPFEALMRWLMAKKQLREARQLRPAGRWWRHMMNRAQNLENLAAATVDATSIKGGNALDSYSAGIYNYESLTSRRPVGYEPDHGTYRIWHGGRLFFLKIYIKSYQHRHDDILRLAVSCYGFSSTPIKQLLEEARAACDNSGDGSTTGFYRAPSGEQDWRRVSERPIRPLNTVALDTAQKLHLVSDVNSFLNLATEKWYSSRGIPYRRGYLFSGPPGTGKTSLSLALAGVFGINLYAVSLQDGIMTEERLTALFDNLPNRCIVLLEDIDSAGIGAKRTRAGSPSSSFLHSRNHSLGDGMGGNDASYDHATRFGEKKAISPINSSSGISLAGLLNAIDGVASHEGHILIMTSNHPEKLDAALRRPGRVDLHIEFTLATTFQAREIFLRMFSDEVRSGGIKGAAGTKGTGIPPTVLTVEEVCRERSQVPGESSSPFMPLEELTTTADAFAAAVPDRALSPAEIQGYLLLHKTNPARALQGASAWAAELCRAKREAAENFAAVAVHSLGVVVTAADSEGTSISGGGSSTHVDVKAEDSDDCVKL